MRLALDLWLLGERTLAAVSVGLVDGVPLLDPAYEEDVRAEVDFNVVMAGGEQLVEVQGTAEKPLLPAPS